MAGEHTYSEAGVDIRAEEEAIGSINQWLEKTLEFRKANVSSDVRGHYSGLYRLGDGRVLSMSTDSVGTKLIVAKELRKYDTVGIDLLGMLANDIVSVGSTPVAMVDYLGVEKPDQEMAADIGKGIYEGCRQAHVVVLGGETATVPELIRGFDLAGAIVGMSSEEDLVLGSQVSEGDVLVGIESSGIHSNGFTLARKVFFTWNDFSVNDPLPTDREQTVGEALMVPTRIYVDVVLDIMSKIRPHGLAHITGGGLTKLRRLKKSMGYSVEASLPTHPVFEAIRKLGKVTWPEMYRTYNMGVGFVVIVAPEDRETAIEVCRSQGLAAKAIGTAVNDSEQRVSVRAQERFVL